MAAGRPTAPIVVVTGANGFIGAHCVHYALAAGYRVRGTVRDVADKKNDFLREMGARCGEALTLVSASLAATPSYPQAKLEADWRSVMAGATYVMHVASPIPVDLPKDVEAEIVRPAVMGVTNVFLAALNAPSVRRIVFTSSNGVMFVGRADMATHTFTDDDWNDLEHSPVYIRSKRLAEDEAWRIIRGQPAGRGLELAVINPGFVLGPVLGRTQSSTGELIHRLMNRTMPMIPHMNLCYVHVHDVALAHLRAMLVPAAAGHRFLLVGDSFKLIGLAQDMAAAFRPLGYPVPTTPLPNWLFRVVAFFDRTLGEVSFMLPATKFDSINARRILGMRLKGAGRVGIDMALSMIAARILDDRTADKRLSSGPAATAWTQPPAPTREELSAGLPSPLPLP